MTFVPTNLQKAMAGPARVLLAPISVAIVTDPYTVVPAVANGSGEYPIVAAAATAGWWDAGLKKDAPGYEHGHDDGDAPEYEETGELTARPSTIVRTFTVAFAQFEDKMLEVVENSTQSETVAAVAGKPAQRKLHVGIYDALIAYRALFMFERIAEGGETVTEPGGRVRPVRLTRVIPRCTITADEKSLEMAKDGAGFECQFQVQTESTLTAARAHGYWVAEAAGTFA